jgi:hypothetical protein
MNDPSLPFLSPLPPSPSPLSPSLLPLSLPLSSPPLSLPSSLPEGNYRFSIEMSDVTAAGCVELWLSTDSDPLNMRKVLVLDYDDMVSVLHVSYGSFLVCLVLSIIIVGSFLTGDKFHQFCHLSDHMHTHCDALSLSLSPESPNASESHL